jgi:hypothetical protein
MGINLNALRRNPTAVALTVIALLAVTQFTGAWGEIRQFVGRLSGDGPAPAAVPGASACADPGRTAAVRAYTLALTDPTGLGTFVRANAKLFAAGGDAIACYGLLAAALASNANLTGIEALRARAEAERETGLEFNRSAYTTDLAGTLRELADSLPALATADDGPYRATRTYESAQAYSTLRQRTRAASEGLDVLLRADEDVLRELAARLSGE